MKNPLRCRSPEAFRATGARVPRDDGGAPRRGNAAAGAKDDS